MIYPSFNVLRYFSKPLPSSLTINSLRYASSSLGSSNLAKLRKRTGLAFTLCKKALELHNNDLDQAELWLKEESIKHGYAKAQQLKNRRAVQGLIGVSVNNDLNRCGLFEVNCETDFVARNDNFKQLAATLTSKFVSQASNLSPSSSKPSTNSSLITKQTFLAKDLEMFNDSISSAITQLGENIKLSRGLILQVDCSKGDLLLFGYAHASGDYIVDIDGIKLGKYGAIVVARELPEEERKPKKVEEKPLEKPAADKAEKTPEPQAKRELTDEEIDNQEEGFVFEEPEPVEYSVNDVGRILCQHVVGMNPIYMRKSPELLKKEKELMEQGYKIPDENEYFLNQKIIVNPSLSVSDFCDDHGLQIIDFVRYECGEEFTEE